MNTHFRTALNALLHEVTPHRGAAFLLYRHPIGGVYFPLAVNVSNDLPTSDSNILSHYYLFSTQLDTEDLTKDHILIGRNATAQCLCRGPDALCQRRIRGLYGCDLSIVHGDRRRSHLLR